MSKPWPKVRLGDVLKPVSRPVEVKPDELYREIGIRSHGKGVFHKAPISGLELGNKRVFWVEPGDFVLNIVFAWEGAVAVLSEAEVGMIGSHRFPTFRADESRLDSRFLLAYLNTREGLALLGRVSPGGAARNRTLSRAAFLEQEVPLLPIAKQRSLITQFDCIQTEIERARAVRRAADEDANALSGAHAHTLFRAFREKRPLSGLSEVRGGIQKGPHRVPSGNPVQYLTVAHVQRNRVLTGDPRFFEVTAQEFERWKLLKGDVLIIEGNGSADQIGRTALFRGEIERCVHQNHVIRIRPDERALIPEFLNLFLNSPSGQDAVQEQSRSTSGLRTLSVGRIKAIPIPVPSLPEQRRIVAALDALQNQVNKLKRLQSETAAELDAMLPALLDRAFGGAM